MTNAHIPSIQDLFVSELGKRFSSNAHLVDYLKQELNIGSSAAYNRVSGKSPLTMYEAQKLALLQSISLDQFILPHYSRITFVSDAMRKLPNSYSQYLTNVTKTLAHLNQMPDLSTTSIGTEIPLFHYANFPNLYHFKLFYWKQTFWNFGNTKQCFSVASREIDEDIHNLTKKIGQEYYKMPSTEIWTVDLFTPILQQIIYFLTLDSFEEPEDAMKLIADVKNMSLLLQEFCKTGAKQLRGDSNASSDIEVYYNELHDGTDGLLFIAGDITYSFIKYDGPNFIRTHQTEFGTYSQKWIANIINKSSGISAKGQRHRRLFFTKVDKKIEQAEKKVRYIIDGMYQ